MKTVQAIPQDSIQHVERLLRKYDKTGLYADIWVFGINTALRVGDILALQMQDVVGKTSVEIIEQKTKTTKKKPAPRTIKFNTAAQAIIAKRHETYPDDTWLFQSRSNRSKSACKAVSREAVARKFKEVGDVLGFDLSTHSMRKTRGKAMFDAGVPIETICKVLCHSTPAVTMAYIGLDAETVADTYDNFVL